MTLQFRVTGLTFPEAQLLIFSGYWDLGQNDFSSSRFETTDGSFNVHFFGLSFIAPDIHCEVYRTSCHFFINSYLSEFIEIWHTSFFNQFVWLLRSHWDIEILNLSRIDGVTKRQYHKDFPCFSISATISFTARVTRVTIIKKNISIYLNLNRLQYIFTVLVTFRLKSFPWFSELLRIWRIYGITKLYILQKIRIIRPIPLSY